MAGMAIPLMVLGIAAIMIVGELLYPGRSWPQVGGWWSRALLLNAVQVGPSGRTTLGVTVNVTPVGSTNPACILWDIKDGCSHEAQGKHEVLESACGS